MKKITSIIALVSLVFSTSAFAQDQCELSVQKQKQKQDAYVLMGAGTALTAFTFIEAAKYGSSLKTFTGLTVSNMTILGATAGVGLILWGGYKLFVAPSIQATEDVAQIMAEVQAGASVTEGSASVRLAERYEVSVDEVHRRFALASDRGQLCEHRVSLSHTMGRAPEQTKFIYVYSPSHIFENNN